MNLSKEFAEKNPAFQREFEDKIKNLEMDLSKIVMAAKVEEAKQTKDLVSQIGTHLVEEFRKIEKIAPLATEAAHKAIHVEIAKWEKIELQKNYCNNKKCESGRRREEEKDVRINKRLIPKITIATIGFFNREISSGQKFRKTEQFLSVDRNAHFIQTPKKKKGKNKKERER